MSNKLLSHFCYVWTKKEITYIIPVVFSVRDQTNGIYTKFLCTWDEGKGTYYTWLQVFFARRIPMAFLVQFCHTKILINYYFMLLHWVLLHVGYISLHCCNHIAGLDDVSSIIIRHVGYNTIHIYFSSKGYISSKSFQNYVWVRTWYRIIEANHPLS